VTIADKLIRAREDFDRVYEAGYEKGSAEGGGGSYDQGFDDGKQEEYDAFWDALQDNGDRTNYGYAFVQWANENFKPKYDINAADLQYAFRYSTITDLAEILKRQGVKLDVSNATNLAGVFFYADGITTCPTIDVSKNLIKDFTVFTHAHAMKTIEKIILPTGKAMTFSNAFHTCTALENVVFEGDIMANGLSFQWSPKLSKDSITSVVNALSPNTSGLTVTFSKTAVAAFDSEITAIPFGLTTAQEGANVTGVDNGDGTATFNGTIGYDTVFVHGNATDVFSAGSYAISFHDANQFDFYVSLFDLDGNHIITYTAWYDASDGVATFTTDKDFVMKASLYAMGPYTFNNEVITYPTIRPDFETLKATKPNWTITEV
jgi:hypothetical protein